MTAVTPEQPRVGAPEWAVLDQHRPDLIRLARARGCGLEDAEDLASEALLRAAAFRDLEPERAGAFLNTVLQRLVVDKYRQDQRHQRLFARVAERAVVTSHEEAVCERHDASVVLGRLNDLPHTERAVLMARAQGAPVALIAARMHLSPKTVEGAYTRARGRVRRMLVAGVAGVFALCGGLKRHSAKLTTAAAAVPVAFLLAPGALGTQPAQVDRTPVTSTLEISAVQHTTTSAQRAPARPPTARAHRADGQLRPRAGKTTVTQSVTVTPPHPTIHDQDETLLESVVRCVHDGPQVSSEMIGCAPQD